MSVEKEELIQLHPKYPTEDAASLQNLGTGACRHRR